MSARRPRAPNLTAGPFSPREKEIQRDIDTLIAVSEKAVSESSYTPGVAAIARAAGLRQELRRAAWARIIATEPDELIQVRHRIAAATEDGSWAAVAALTAQERDLIRTRAAERAAEEERKRQAGDHGAVMAALKEELAALPVGMLEELAAYMDARRIGIQGVDA